MGPIGWAQHSDDPSNEPLPVGRASLLHLRADWPLRDGMSAQGCISCLAETVKLPRGGSASRETCPKEPITPSHEEESIAVNAWVVGAANSTSLFVDGPTTNWLGPEAVVKLVVEGCEVNTLADSGSQAKTVTPELITENRWQVLPLKDLVDHPLHLVGLGGNRTWLLGFVILRVQVKEIAGYDEDVIFLIVPNGSDFSKRVPLVIGTCTLGRVVNVIKESELDMLLPPWAVVHASRLLSIRRGTATSNNESSGDVADPEPSASALEPETDVPVYIRERVCVGAFQMQILECKVDPLQEKSVEVMVIPVRSGGLQGAKIKPLPPGLQVLYVFTVQKRGSSKVSIVVSNVSESPIYLKTVNPSRKDSGGYPLRF